MSTSGHKMAKARLKRIREKDKDLLNNYLVSMIFYDIKTGKELYTDKDPCTV